APSSTTNARRDVRGLFGYQTRRRIADIADGTSNTIAMGEIGTSRGGRHFKGATARGLGMGVIDTPNTCLLQIDQSGNYLDSVPTVILNRGQRWARGAVQYTAVNTILPPNSPSCTYENDFRSIGQYPMTSYHPGGVHVLLADGSVRLVSETIHTGNLSLTDPKAVSGPSPYGVWGALGSIAGGEIAGDF
ncbi:MAG: DUF1559 domain-containing protein, partial [Planctomycetota bacterium]|nr:DUF1559 domain-containing protein [Planctomycetota bacterium]